MKHFLCVALVIALFGVVALAEPDFDGSSSIVESDDALWVRIPKSYVINMENAEPTLLNRHRRSEPKTQINGGGGSGKGGTDVYVQGQTSVWKSPNGKNEVNVNGNYGQHFGGPGGSSRPSVGGGVSFTRRW